MSVEKMLAQYGRLIDERFETVFSNTDNQYGRILDAMKYSLLSGGKRLRPALLLEFCKICGGDLDTAVDFACAVEMIHTYSLIHDDLPCMDNDDTRRGKPSCHIAFGEDLALLAGDGLLTLAFELASKCRFPARSVLKAISVLAEMAGVQGMIGGQVIDLESENKVVDIDTIKKMYSLKTGALLKAACSIGCILPGADEEKVGAAKEYADNIGLAFQIVDDILDVVGDSQKLGKPVGSDADNHKSTFVAFYGIEHSKKLVLELTQAAKQSLDVFGKSADRLIELADFLVLRDH
ncbi:MAG: polyprenyl synthetase family protein [bacterium]|nr:polyprenyl synthetase family protein [bacterium]